MDSVEGSVVILLLLTIMVIYNPSEADVSSRKQFRVSTPTKEELHAIKYHQHKTPASDLQHLYLNHKTTDGALRVIKKRKLSTSPPDIDLEKHLDAKDDSLMSTTVSLTQENNLNKSNSEDVSSQAVRPNSFENDPPCTTCPAECRCEHFDNATIKLVDCSSRGLTKIPRLPYSARQVWLQNNAIDRVPCGIFKDNSNLELLILSQNPIRYIWNDSFQGLHTLEHLYVSKGQLTNLPSGIFDSLESLRVLDLSKNNITGIRPRTFLSLRNLKNLNLYNNKLVHLKNDTFQGLTSLQFLSLQRNKLRYIPGTFETGAFLGLQVLETLHINGNQAKLWDELTYPDKALSQLSSLNRLRMDGWPIALGPGFSALTNLSYLELGRNHHDQESFCRMYKQIPSNFFVNIMTKKPLSLNMSACSLTVIPVGLFKPLPTIYSLDLSHNDQLGYDNFEQGSIGLQDTTLTHLNLSAIVDHKARLCEIKNTTFRYLKNTTLKVLVIEHGRLFDISPMALMDLPMSVEYISFYDNKLQFAEYLYSLLRFKNLRVLKLSRQLHFTMPSPLGSWKDDNSHEYQLSGIQRAVEVSQSSCLGIKHVDLFERKKNNELFLRTQLKRRKNGDNFCDNLNNMYFSEYNDLPFPIPAKLEVVLASDIKSPYNIPPLRLVGNKALRHFDYSNNNVKCFGGPVLGLEHLTDIDLSRNWCLRINPRFFSDFGNLRVLIMYKNYLGQSFADDKDGVIFSFLNHLETLDLSENSIKELSEVAFQNNRKLRLLNLSHNELNFFQPSLTQISALDILDLSTNMLQGFSESSCNQLKDMKRRNPVFVVNIDNNGIPFHCDCDNIYFLTLLVEHPELFMGLGTFQCDLRNGTQLPYGKLSLALPELVLYCMFPTILIAVLVFFFLVIGSALVVSLYCYKRWKLKYLMYIGKSRLHIGATNISFRPVAQAFITYDQEQRVLRRLVRTVFLPQLHRLGVSFVHGEVDFGGGPLESSIAGAVASTKKTLVLLTKDIFKEYLRQFEINLAIIHELNLRRPLIVPVFLLPQHCGDHRNVAEQAEAQDRDSLSSTDTERIEEDINNVDDQRVELLSAGPSNERARLQPNAIHEMTPRMILQGYPPEIATFLKGQAHRCLVFDGGSQKFWDTLRTALFSDDE